MALFICQSKAGAVSKKTRGTNRGNVPLINAGEKGLLSGGKANERAAAERFDISPVTQSVLCRLA